MVEIPLGLRRALESGECVLFLGAGIGCHLLDEKGNPAPDGKSLARELSAFLSIEFKDYDLTKISQLVEIRKGRRELEAFLRKRLINLEPDKFLQWLTTFSWKAIYTTNYDRGIERAYELNSKPPQTPISFSVTSDITAYDTRFEVPIIHLHGSLYASLNQKIIITERDYTEYQERRRMLFQLLKKDVITWPILYIGYSNNDPNWKMIISEITSEFLPSKPPVSYRVNPETDPIETEILKSTGIETIDCTFKDFVGVVDAAMTESKVGSDKLSQMRSSVPTDLVSIFDKTPAAIVRLLTAWVYLNNERFQESPNIPAFLRGDRPNWSLVGGNNHFERDIEDQIYLELLEYATGNTPRPSVNIILGSAGYGVTTLMMSLAAKLVKEKAGPVFMIKPNQPLREGDVELAATLSSARPFFFIDMASDYTYTLKNIIQRFKEKKIAAMFIFGERFNEWRQNPGRISGKEFEIEPLSDPEINRLLDCLQRHGELNQLEHLSRDLQFGAIKEKHDRELLVAMREATEGKSFDAILEDEYRGIGGKGDDFPRQVYLTTCCFYQHGAYIRDSLLAQIMNINLGELYPRIKNSTDGIVIFDCIDEGEKRYAARARHRTIAAVIWERCGSPEERERILQNILSMLNLNYKIDKDAFESFVRSDRIVGAIRSFEGKTKFFDSACRKDPESPFVRQHYARMLLREHKEELALGQSQEALKLNSRSAALHHTNADILSEMALNTESIDIARRRLIQSEASFRQSLNCDSRNEYCYQGLAQLYFGWAKRVQSTEESSEYIAKAEEIIFEGLKSVREKDSLWIESSKIQKWHGDRPGYLESLEKAVRDTPSSVIARYLLGRAYRLNGNYDKALSALAPVIRNYHDEYRCFIEYALSLLCLKKVYKSSIAVLKLSTLYGYDDARFLATLAGMYVMDEQPTEAAAVFVEAGKHNFSTAELNTLHFRPWELDDPSRPLRIRGRVIARKAGYAIIQSERLGNFICPGSKWNDLLLDVGLNVTFEPGFTAKSCFADKPVLLK